MSMDSGTPEDMVINMTDTLIANTEIHFKAMRVSKMLSKEMITLKKIEKEAKKHRRVRIDIQVRYL